MRGAAVCLLLILFVVCYVQCDNDIVERFVKQVGGQSSVSQSQSASINEAGHSVVGGYFSDTSFFNETFSLTSEGGDDGYVAKYSKSGMFEWAVKFGSAGDDKINQVVATSDAVYVAGTANGAISVDGTTLTSSGGSDAFVAKLSLEDGTLVWAYQFGSSSDDMATTIAIGMDAVYVGGQASGSFTVQTGGTSQVVSFSSGTDGFVVSFSPAGVVAWAMGIGGSADEIITSVVEGFDGVYFAGQTNGDTINTQSVVSYGGTDCMIGRLAPESGVLEWVETFGTSGDDSATGIAYYDDDIFVVGATNGALPSNLNNGVSDAFIAKFDSDGNNDWYRQYGGSGDDKANSVVVAYNGTIYTAGYYSAAFSIAGNTLTAFGSSDIYVAEFSIDGEELWAKGFGGAGLDVGTGIAANNQPGFVISASIASPTIEFDTQTITAKGSNDGLLLRYGSPYFCNSTLFSDASVCNGRGECLEETGTCSCELGYEGDFCEQSRTCFGVDMSDPNACSGNGVCYGNDNCTCEEGYTGESCSIAISSSAFASVEVTLPQESSINIASMSNQEQSVAQSQEESGSSVEVSDSNLQYESSTTQWTSVVSIRFLQGTSVNITMSNMVATYGTATPDHITYTVSNVLHGNFVTRGSTQTRTAFTQEDINNGDIAFVHDGSTSTPSFTLTLSTLSGAQNVVTSMTLTLALKPRITVSNIRVKKGKTLILSSDMLQTNDNVTPATDIVFTVKNVQHGRFELRSNPGVAITSFTQQQINDGGVQFVHDNSNSDASFEISVTNGELASEEEDSTVVVEEPSTDNNRAGKIAGGVIGGFFGLVLVILLLVIVAVAVFMFIKSSKQQDTRKPTYDMNQLEMLDV